MPQFRIICLRLLVCACVRVCVCVSWPPEDLWSASYRSTVPIIRPKLVPLVLWNNTSHETLQPTKIWGQPWFNHPSWCGDYTLQSELDMGPVYEPKLEVLCMNHSFGGSKWKKHIPNSNEIKGFGYLDCGFSRKRRMDWAVFGVAPAAFHELSISLAWLVWTPWVLYTQLGPHPTWAWGW